MSADAQATGEETATLSLESTVTEVEPCRVKLEITVKRESVDRVYEEGYEDLQQNAQVRGFRRGHAPRRILERRFARHLRKDVARKLVGEALQQCLQENELHPLAEPEIDFDKLEAEPERDFSFSVELDVRPKFELPEYKGLELEAKPEPVTEEDVDRAVENLQKTFATAHDTEKPMAEGMQVIASAKLEIDGKTMGENEEFVLSPETESVFGFDAEAIRQHLIGAVPGRELEIVLTAPDDYPAPELRGKKAVLQVSVKRVQRLETPEIDDAFVRDRLHLDNLARLRELLRRQQQEEAQQRAREAQEREIIERLVREAKFDLPRELLERQTQAIAARFRLRMQRAGASEEILQERADEIDKESSREAERKLRWMIIYETIAEKENLEVTPQEVQQQIELLARLQRVTPARMLRRIQELGGMKEVVGTMREMKVIQLIMANARTAGGEESGEAEKSADEAAAERGNGSESGTQEAESASADQA